MPIEHIVLFLGLTLFPILVSDAEAFEQTAGSPITYGDSSVENNFPASLTFSITATGDEGDITSAIVFYKTREGISSTRQVVAFEPSDQVDLSYTWDTSNVTIAPSTPIVYYWEVKDSNGNRAISEETTIFYDDIRFEWHILEDENIAVWWHDRPISFGGRVNQIAQEAFDRQSELFRADLDYQIRILIYNDFEEFADWHSYVSEFTGGQAFPSIGVTAQIVSAYDSEDYWLNGVIPHEISHLYFYQAASSPMVEVPAWLNEGIAQLNEVYLDAAAMEYARRVIQDGDLLPLWSLTGGFGYDEAKVRLAYAESLSAAFFLRERYGSDGISKLLAAYKNDLSGDEALMKGLGVSLVDFQNEWLEWMGVDSNMYPAPTPEPALAWPTPRSWSTPTSNPTATIAPTSTKTQIPSVTPSTTPVDTPSSPPTETQESRESVAPSEIVNESEDVITDDESNTGQSGLAICGSIAMSMIAIVGVTRIHTRSEAGY